MRSLRSEVYRLLRDRHLLSPTLNRALEKGFLICPESAYEWAEYYRKGPWPEGEAVIAQDAFYSCLYAKNTLEYNRFLKGEPVMALSEEYAYYYATEVLHGRFRAAEPMLANSYRFSHWYATVILHLDLDGERRWKDGKSAKKWESDHSTPF